LPPPRQEPLIKDQLGCGDGFLRLYTDASFLLKFVLPEVFSQLLKDWFFLA
jgi:hypothetical protein